MKIQMSNDPSSRINFRFTADSSGHGFTLLVMQHLFTCVGPLIPITTVSPIGCNKVFDADNGVFGVSKFLNTSVTNRVSDCQFIFNPPVVSDHAYCGVKFTFLSFDLSSNCVDDYLYLNGKRYCHRDLRDAVVVVSYPSKTDHIKMTFNAQSSEFSSNEFITNYQRVKNGCPVNCDVTTGNASFSLRSPGEATYLNNADCSYTIRKDKTINAKCLQIRVNKLSLHSENQQCTTDYLDLFDRKRICRMSQLPSTDFKVPFPVDSDELKAHFHSDDSGVDRGFDISVKQIADGCPKPICQRITKSEMMTSLNYPSNYPRNSECNYVVEKLYDEPMTLTMIPASFDASYGTELILPNGTVISRDQHIVDSVIMPLLNNIVIPFSSSTKSSSGFQIFIHQYKQEKFDLCSKDKYDQKSGEIHTPGFGTGVYTAADCFVKISRNGKSCKISLTVKTFSLVDKNTTTGKCDDYIDWGRDGIKCGEITPEEFGIVVIPFPEGKENIFIKFYFDSTTDNRAGAEFHYEQSDIDCID